MGRAGFLVVEHIVREDVRALHPVAQLADVPAPLAPRQVRERAGLPLLLGVRSAVEVVEEVLREQLDVAGAVAQRWQRDREHRQAEVEVLAELAFLDGVLGVAVGRGQHADVRLNGRRAADALDVPGLEHAEQLHLELRRHLRDLVEEKRPAVRAFEEAAVQAIGAGEAALLVAEQLALDQRLRDRAAVHGHERRRLAPAELVQGLGDELLARAALALDQHARVRRCDALDDVEHGLHRC